MRQWPRMDGLWKFLHPHLPWPSPYVHWVVCSQMPVSHGCSYLALRQLHPTGRVHRARVWGMYHCKWLPWQCVSQSASCDSVFLTSCCFNCRMRMCRGAWTMVWPVLWLMLFASQHPATHFHFVLVCIHITSALNPHVRPQFIVVLGPRFILGGGTLGRVETCNWRWLRSTLSPRL